MKKLFTLLLSLVATATFAQFTAPAIQWQKCFGGTGSDVANAVQQTSDGGFIIAGSSESTSGNVTGNHGGSDYWVVKLDGAGSLQWQKSLGETSNDIARSVQQTADGGYIVGGTTFSTSGDVTGNHGSADYWVIKLDGMGTIQWQRSLGGSDIDFAYALQQTADSGYVVVGYSRSANGDVTGSHGYDDCWVVKLSSAGILQWQTSLGGTSSDIAYAVQQTDDGGYIVGCHSASTNGDVTGNHGNPDYWVVKLNSAGAIQWQKSLGGTGAEFAYAIRQTADGGYIVVGESESTNGNVLGNHGASDYWVVKLDDIGTIQWQKSLGGTAIDRTFSVRQTTDGGYILAGGSASNDGDVLGNHSASDFWVVKLDDTGSIQWQKSLGGTGEDYAYAVHQTSDGGFIIAGSSNSTNGDVTGNHGGNDYWIVKLGPDPAAVSSIAATESFSLYPNPARTEIFLQSTEAMRSVFFTDISGREVYRTSISGNSVSIPTIAIPNGLYLVRLQTANSIVTKKVLVQH